MKHAPFALLIVLSGLLVAGCGGDSTAGTGSPGSTFRELKACDLLTLDDAKKLIGADAASNDEVNKETSTSDVSVTICQFSDATADHFASVLVRAPKSEAGAGDNENTFNAGRPAGAQDVTGYGDRAYFDPADGQLYVLAHRVYLIFSGTSNNLADAQKVADSVLPRLP